MTLYAITKGEYSDYHICALTADKEKAERLKKIFTDKWDEAEIEEYEDGENGEIKIMWRYDVGTGNVDPAEYEGTEMVVEDNYGCVCSVQVYAPDANKACKKAFDMLAKYRAEQAGL